jgi:hypothetical protein
MQTTDLQMLRQTLKLDKQDLQRFLADPHTPPESIATVKKAIAEKEAKIALFPAG